MSFGNRSAAIGLMALVVAGCEGGAPTVEPEAPKDVVPAAPAPPPGAYLPDPNRAHAERVLWGDPHVHTGWSMDAGTAGSTLTPEDAVRFAQGEEVKSTTGAMAKLPRAHDWIVVTDHSDGMGTINEIKAGNPEMLADPTVKKWHDGMVAGGEAAMAAAAELVGAFAAQKLPSVMTDPKWNQSAWEKSVDIMEKHNEPGVFTALIGYEWTSNGETGQNLHRNVIFRDGADKTRATLPLTTVVSTVPGVKGTDPESLWKWLWDWEEETGGKALAIPHNGNMSHGWMFREARYDGSPLTPEWAQSRARWEPLVEVFQYKGASETHPSLSPLDEFADYELYWDNTDLAANPQPRGSQEFEYARQALRRGLAHADGPLGTNPYKFGMVAASDTHTALATGGEEGNYWGKFISGEPHPGRANSIVRKEDGGKYVRKEWTLAAQGLTGVWATANTREAIFDAMMRKEVYATSGPRMTIRFYGGYEFAEADAAGDIAKVGYAKGVPMGGDLAKAPAGKAPTFLIAAMKDPQSGNLDRVQVVKGWVDAEGKTHEKVFDVKSSGDRKPGEDGKLPAVGNTVDLKTATYTNTIGAAELAVAWTDPEFDPTRRAFYYARVIEIPTPRWTAYDVVRFGDKMDTDVPMIIQERAVTSPIWYAP